MFLQFLLYFNLVRVLDPIGKISHLPYINHTNVTTFIHENEKAIGIFTENTFQRIDSANFPISYFEDIHFFTSTYETGLNFRCKTFPCLRAFKNGVLLDSSPDSFFPIDISLWCHQLFPSKEVYLSHPENLRQLFESHGVFVIGVNVKQRPTYLQPEQTFYRVRLEYFSYFGINISSGVYVYRSADRQLVKVSGNIKNYLKSSFIDLEIHSFENRQFLGFFVLNNTDISENNRFLEIVNQVSSSFKNFYFAIANYYSMTDLIHRSRTQLIKPPFLLIFETNVILESKSLFDQKWFVNLTNITESNFRSSLNEIQSKPKSIISSQPSQSLNYLSNLNFNSSILNSENDIVVLFLVFSDYRNSLLNLTFQKISEKFQTYPFLFYLYDCSTNELPFDVDIYQSEIRIFHKEDIENSRKYSAAITSNGIADFILEEASNRYSPPNCNWKDIDDEIKSKLSRNITRS